LVVELAQAITWLRLGRVVQLAGTVEEGALEPDIRQDRGVMERPVMEVMQAAAVVVQIKRALPAWRGLGEMAEAE